MSKTRLWNFNKLSHNCFQQFLNEILLDLNWDRVNNQTNIIVSETVIFMSNQQSINIIIISKTISWSFNNFLKSFLTAFTWNLKSCKFTSSDQNISTCSMSNQIPSFDRTNLYGLVQCWKSDWSSFKHKSMS